MSHKPLWLTPIFTVSLLALPGCGSDDADADSNGAGACTVTDVGDGTSAIRCPDGTELVVSNGKDGNDGKDGVDGSDGDKGETGNQGDKGDAADCTLGKSADGKDTLTCGGQTVTIGDPCEDGYYGDVFLYDRDHTESQSFTLFQVTNCTWIRGELDIDGFDGETLPKALSRLEKVDGGIYIGFNDSLEKVAFPALVEVGGDLTIRDNDALTEIGDFPALKTLGDELYIGHNPELVSIGNFPKLETSVGWVRFLDNEKLESIGSFDNLVELHRPHRIIWEDNPSLVEMGSFPALESADYLHIRNNDSLKSLSVFSSLKTIGEIEIMYHAELLSIEGIASLEKVTGVVKIWENAKLPQCHVDDVLSDIDFVRAVADIGSNDDSATCP